MTITPEEFTEKLNELRAGIAEDRLISTQFNDPVQPEVLVLETLIRSYDENAALRERVEALEKTNLRLEETAKVLAEQVGKGNLGKIQDALNYAHYKATEREAIR